MIRIQKTVHGTPLITVWFADEELKENGLIVYKESKVRFGGSTEFKTLISDLSLSKEDIVLKFAKNCRYKVKRAYRENVEVVIKAGEDITDTDIESFLDFFEAFWKSKEVAFDSKESLRQEMVAYRNIGALQMSQAIIEGETAVYHTHLMDEDYGRLFHSASLYRNSASEDDSKKNLIGMANRMLHCEDMYYFKDTGRKYYDWGGAGTAEDVASITEFKKSFGGDEVIFYSCEKINGAKARMVDTLSRVKHMIK